jgi:hypothetical protein
LADKPTNVTVNAIASRSATISWQDPEILGVQSLLNFRFEVKKDNKIILAITLPKVNKYNINNLAPYTRYQISVASGNIFYGFDEEAIFLFTTSEEGRCKNWE